ncbi:aminotransferase class V-fold PLP-dependent enzyme [Bacillus sp. NSP9.1]|uniref:aminotransferase class V-fold PLP-dependent enzyme n=1 Tax=Bacillus sp. NSP9.1 TaxID=1071078 RepID=UPI00047CC8AB|nr:aminotransferase class V-fold PLP-dependent enzyme [Bacillus sp. NSP9.1]QHZ45609.1 aminotransferase class V-fold PLP-dependent enzyme [Bacillus sp. NSP9.1]
MEHPYHIYRALFPVLTKYVHLAACSGGALALPVARAIEKYHSTLLETGANWQAHLAKMEEAKEKFARLIGAEIDEIAVVPSVSDAVSAIAVSLPEHPKRRQIAFTDLDFPAIGQIWLAQDRFNHHLTVIHSQDGMIRTEQYEKEINDQTLLTCVPHVSYCNGVKQSLTEIAEIVHHKGSLLFVDAYQSAGHIPIHVKDMKIDMLAAGTRKYMLGIPGTAFLYVRRELCEQLRPKVTGWFGKSRPSSFDLLHSGFAEGAKRFETGTPSFIGLYAADAALKLLLEAGPEEIEAYLQKLARFSLQYGADKGLQIIGPQNLHNRSSLASFRVKDATQIEALLREKNIITSARNGAVRIAPHFYNTKEDIAHAVDELAALIHRRTLK